MEEERPSSPRRETRVELRVEAVEEVEVEAKKAIEAAGLSVAPE